MKIVEKQLDPEGRLLLPKDWREKHGRDVVIIELEGYLKIVPKERKKLTEFFDSVATDVAADWSDWKAVRRELHAKRWQR